MDARTPRRRGTDSPAARRHRRGRAGPRGLLHVSVSPPRPPDAEYVRAYGGLEVDRLIVVPPMGVPASELERFVEEHAPSRTGARPAV